MGMLLEEIPVAGGTAAIEPSLDYIVAKFPRFPFDKFSDAPNTLGTQMKATGEVMAIGSTLEECFLKSSRSLEAGVNHLYLAKFDPMTPEELFDYISTFRADGIFAVTELIARGADLKKIHEVTMITPLFLEALKNIIDMENKLSANKGDVKTLAEAKAMGFSDKYVARLWKTDELSVCALRKEAGLRPVFRMVDTLHTGKYIAYLYSSYANLVDENIKNKRVNTLLRLEKIVQKDLMQKCINKRYNCLIRQVNGVTIGITDGGREIYIPNYKYNNEFYFANVKIESIRNHKLSGVIDE